jgi:hypothetical protein
MAHYAFLDENYIVTEVIVGRDESNFDWERHYGDIRGQLCKRTSYNTVGGVHNNGGQPFRKNYAGIGYVYDPVRDAFYAQQPYPSWVLNEQTCLWESRVPYPNDGKQYRWNEDDLVWEEMVEVM